MLLPKFDLPTQTFRYKISRRLNLLSVPKKHIIQTDEGMPAYTCFGVRQSALRSQLSDRVHDAAWPYLRRMVILKRQYKNRFSTERLEHIDRVIEATNGTCYSKLANCAIAIVKKSDTKEVKRKRGWSESEWKKRLESLSALAAPKKDFRPPPPSRGVRKPLDELRPRINNLVSFPDFKVYRRLSQEPWYKNPMKVPPNALKYVISERTKKLAEPRVIQHD